MISTWNVHKTPLPQLEGDNPLECVHSRRWDIFVWRFERHLLVLEVLGPTERWRVVPLPRGTPTKGRINDARLSPRDLSLHLACPEKSFKPVWVQIGEKTEDTIYYNSGFEGLEVGSEYLQRDSLADGWVPFPKKTRSALAGMGASEEFVVFPQTVTCGAIGPARSEDLEALTGHLKLL